MATTFRRIGIRNVADAALFLISDWQNLRGMNNCLLYGVGIFGANASGGVGGSPYNTSLSYNTTDSLTGTLLNIAPSSSFQANGELPVSTNFTPTKGYVYVAYGNADGASAQRVFQNSAISQQNPQTWKSYVADGAMWIGDTPTRRLFWQNNGTATSTLDIQSMANISLSPNPSNPNVVGSNFSGTYQETEQLFAPPPAPFAPLPA
jgi:hypothetical protein